jgi:ACS family tartrate transporter-like MFS transporter
MKYMPGIAHRNFAVTSTFAALRGWQWLFMLEAVPSFVMTFVVLVYLTDKPHQAKWLDPEERAALIEILEKERIHTEGRHGHSLWQAFTHPRVLLLTSIYLTMNICNYGVDFWLPIILKGFKGIDTSKPNIYNMLPYISAAIGMVVIGTHSDKTRERSLHIFVPCLLSAIAMLGFAWYQGRSAFGGLVCITIATIGPRAILGPFWTLPPMFLTGTALAGAIAAINSVGNLGGIIGPTLFGKMKDVTGSDAPGIVMLAAAILLTGLLGLCVRKDVVATLKPEGSPS